MNLRDVFDTIDLPVIKIFGKHYRAIGFIRDFDGPTILTVKTEHHFFIRSCENIRSFNTYLDRMAQILLGLSNQGRRWRSTLAKTPTFG